MLSTLSSIRRGFNTFPLMAILIFAIFLFSGVIAGGLANSTTEPWSKFASPTASPTTSIPSATPTTSVPSAAPAVPTASPIAG